MSQKWKTWSEEGMRWPFLHDPSTGKPSITLLFPYITGVMAIISTISLHFSDKLFIATATTIGFWVIAMVLYMMRKISKAKFDLDDRSINLDSGEEEKESQQASVDAPQKD